MAAIHSPAALAMRSDWACLTAATSLAEAPKPSVHQSGQAPRITLKLLPYRASISLKNSDGVAVLSFGQVNFSFHCLIISHALVEGGELSVMKPECCREIRSYS